MVECTCPYIYEIRNYGINFVKRKLRLDINPFWKDVLQSYLSLSLNLKPKYTNQYYSIHLWDNPEIKVGNSSIHLNRWIIIFGRLSQTRRKFLYF